ncbi:MAG: nucleotide exchange factor GrpE [Lentisphaeria bacterium]|nr:nucleotide exchange factor GrpE [Lentisphaeria bacterium]
MFKKKENKPEEVRNPDAEKVDAIMNEAEKVQDEAAEAATPELTEEEKLKAELAELQTKYLYLQAEYQNFRKRSVRDIADARSYTIASTLVPFLSVVDYLGMAQSAVEQSDNLEALKQGMNMIIGEFDKALDELGVKRMKTAGEKFDPALHDAVSYENSADIPEGMIIREWSGGFMLGDKLLRPARVLVSSGSAPEEAAETADDKKE